MKIKIWIMNKIKIIPKMIKVMKTLKPSKNNKITKKLKNFNPLSFYYFI